MIIDQENKRILIEPRDINYILPAYIRQYLFLTRNEEIKTVVFPMFQSVPHPDGRQQVPIEWIPDTDPVALSIIEDGSVVPEVSEVDEARIDEKDEEIKRLKAELNELQEKQLTEIEQVEEVASITPPKSKQQPAQPLPQRQPKLPPGGDIGPGVSPSNMGKRETRLERQIRQDLRDEPGVDESKEIEAEVEKQ